MLKMKSEFVTPSLSKLALALLIATCSTTLFAQTAHRPVDYKNMGGITLQETSGFNGWSAGIGLGVMTSMMNNSSTSAMTSADSPYISGGVDGSSFNGYGNGMNYKYGPMGSLFIGYGCLKDIYYVGAALGVNVLGARALNASQSAGNNIIVTSSDTVLALVTLTNIMSTQTSITRGWAEPYLDIKLGGLITPETLAYGIIGTSYNSLTIKSDSVYVSNGVVDTVIGAPNISLACASASVPKSC
jgi:hypothetical protein